LPEEYEKYLVRINTILREAWTHFTTSRNKQYRKDTSLSLAKECYFMKLDLFTNAGLVDDAIRFVSEHSSNSNKELVSNQKEDNIQQSKESDYDEDSKLEGT
jgi:hypothetical protein